MSLQYRRSSGCSLFSTTLLLLLLFVSFGAGFSFLGTRPHSSSFAALVPRQGATMLTMKASKQQLLQPLYITIGPPCSGKTTLLHRLQERMNTTIHDVTLDAQRNVYVQVPTHYFLTNNNNDTTDTFLKKRILYKSLSNRIYDNVTNGELRFMIQRFHGKLSSREFESCIRTLYTQHANVTNNNNETTREYHEEMATLVIETVEQVCQEDNNITLSPFIQLFCVESLFRPHPLNNKTGVDAALDELEQYSKLNTTSIAWGNTNTRPRDYRQALEIAATTKRPVYFIVYATNQNNISSSGVHLPHVGMRELMKRNIKRMLKTGKFVPGKSLVESNDRIENVLKIASDNLERRYPKNEQKDFTKLQLDQELARMVNYELMNNRTVRRMNVKRNKRKPRARKPPPRQQPRKERKEQTT